MIAHLTPFTVNTSKTEHLRVLSNKKVPKVVAKVNYNCSQCVISKVNSAE